ncbi:unnamed protein product [Urochloa humidicola]
MAEPGKETLPAPPPPQQGPAAVVEPVEGISTPPPPPPPQEAEPTAGVASALDPASPTAELARRAAPQEEPDDAAAPLTPQEASSVQGAEGEEKPEEGKVAAAGRPQEGEEKPEEKLAAPPPAVAPDGRRRWRHLQAAVRLIFLPCERAARRGQSTPLPEDKRSETKPPESTPAVEGGTKPSAPEEAATSPPSGEATATQMTEKPPPEQKQEGGGAPEPEHASSVQEEEKDAALEGDGKLARRRWRWLHAAVNLIFLRPKPKDMEDKGEAKPSAPASGKIEQKPEPAPQREESTGGVPDKAGVKEKDEGEESKGGAHDVTKAGAVAGDAAAGSEGTPAPPAGSMAKRFQKAGKRLMRIMSWYKRHRSSSRVGGEPEATAAPTEEEGKGDGDKGSAADAPTKTAPAPAMDGKQPASGTEEKEKPTPPHPKWAREEERLEKILEDSFTRLLAAEFHQLRPIRKKCLLTFSVFDLAAEVKKQAMLYWWVSEFNLRHRSDQSPNNSDDAAAPAAEMTARRRRRSSCRQQARKSKAAVTGIAAVAAG